MFANQPFLTLKATWQITNQWLTAKSTQKGLSTQKLNLIFPKFSIKVIVIRFRLTQLTKTICRLSRVTPCFQ